MTIRTFIALEIPDELKKLLIDVREKHYPNSGEVKWETESKLHLTLKFLGDTNEKIIEKISNNISRILKDYGPLSLLFTGFGIFKYDGRPKILWAGFEGNEILTNLVKEIEQICLQFGSPKEKKNFSPHLTLLRLKGNEKIDLIYKIVNCKFERVNFISDTITFFKSELKSSGAEYTAIKKFYLKKELANVKR